MKLVEFLDGFDYRVFVNPINVTHVKEYRPGLTMICFNSSKEDAQINIVVKGEVEEVVIKLQNL